MHDVSAPNADAHGGGLRLYVPPRFSCPVSARRGPCQADCTLRIARRVALRVAEPSPASRHETDLSLQSLHARAASGRPNAALFFPFHRRAAAVVGTL